MAISVNDIKSIASFPNTVTEATIQDAITLSEIVLKTAGLYEVGLAHYILETIQKYVAGHFCLLSAGGEPNEIKTGDASVRFNKALGVGLKATTYGQAAISLDPTGKLAKMNAKTEGPYKTVSISFVGNVKR